MTSTDDDDVDNHNTSSIQDNDEGTSVSSTSNHNRQTKQSKHNIKPTIQSKTKQQPIEESFDDDYTNSNESNHSNASPSSSDRGDESTTNTHPPNKPPKQNSSFGKRHSDRTPYRNIPKHELEIPHIINLKHDDDDDDDDENQPSDTTNERTPDHKDGIGPYTLRDMRNTLTHIEELSKFHRIARTVYIYIESASTGRFYRYAITFDTDKPRHHHLSLRTEQRLTREETIERLRRNSHLGFHFLRGILAGYAVSTLREAFLVRTTMQFVWEYSRCANETRRFYVMGITLGLTGAYSHCDSESLGGGSSESVKRVVSRRGVRDVGVMAWCLMAFHLLALVLTLISSKVDAELYRRLTSSSSSLDDDDEEEWSDKIRLLKAIMISRSLCCILCWMISCYGQLKDAHRLANLMNVWKTRNVMGTLDDNKEMEKEVV